jgi:hypothetical protein
MRKLWVLTALSLAAPAFAAAQHHGGMAAAPPVAVAPHAVAGAAVAPHAAAVAHSVPGMVGARTVGAPGTNFRRAPINTTTTQHRNNGFVGLSSLPAFSPETANVPGLGFDFAHAAAIAGRRSRHRFDFDGGFGGLGFSGFLLSPGVVVEEVPVESQAPVEEAAVPRYRDYEGEPQHEVGEGQLLYPATPALGPQHDAAEYVFVRRDGSLVFAVAYSWDNGTLRYITRDGLRGSVTQSSLDLEATQQFNEQRGVNFRLPA